jgi:hypothetical protein
MTSAARSEASFASDSHDLTVPSVDEILTVPAVDHYYPRGDVKKPVRGGHQ